MKLSSIQFGIVFLLVIIMITLYFSILRKSFHFLEGATPNHVSNATEPPPTTKNPYDNLYNTHFINFCNETQKRISRTSLGERNKLNTDMQDGLGDKLMNSNAFKEFNINRNDRIESQTLDMYLTLMTKETAILCIKIVNRLIGLLNDFRAKLENINK